MFLFSPGCLHFLRGNGEGKEFHRWAGCNWFLGLCLSTSRFLWPRKRFLIPVRDASKCGEKVTHGFQVSSSSFLPHLLLFMNIKILWFERRNLGQEGVRVISHDLGDLFWRKDSLRSVTGGNKDQVVVFFFFRLWKLVLWVLELEFATWQMTQYSKTFPYLVQIAFLLIFLFGRIFKKLFHMQSTVVNEWC